ncbi:response regulator [Candidatus Amarolinea dominans]|uniref:response regulator n=1 Tax=Candidatus Amarolinea dominans TaxID=3140696 RepID=UPI0031373EFA|nr:response regulator [Anaerolineae bacterium]
MAYKVLAVDDDRDLLRMMVLVLQNAGYEVLPARSGSEALSILGSHLPDVVILDVMMPGISGYDLVRWLRANPVTAAVPVIMLTAKALQQDKAFGFEAGADDYLTKPVSHSELLMRVKSLLRRATVMPAAVGSTSHFIGFLGAKGGVGTTTLAINTASVLLSGEHEAILVDLQPITSALITLNLAAPALPANMTNGNGGVLADANALQRLHGAAQ